MGKTSIEWTDASWNPIVGCTEISPGCANCYAARLAATRLRETPQYKNLANMTWDKGEFEAKAARPRWNGQVRFLPERLKEPLHWRKPRRIFVCDMGDLFHEAVHMEWITMIVKTIRECPQHTFQILTKRAERMKDYMRCIPVLPNIWLGVSVENQHFADERIPLLLATPAAVRWISAEPLLGPVDLCGPFERSNVLSRPCTCALHDNFADYEKHAPICEVRRWIDWVVCGGESGPNARPMHPDWARTLRDRCQASGIPFFFKQWGNFSPVPHPGDDFVEKCRRAVNWKEWPDGTWMHDYGKKLSGRLLDGREWNEFPQVTP